MTVGFSDQRSPIRSASFRPNRRRDRHSPSSPTQTVHDLGSRLRNGRTLGLSIATDVPVFLCNPASPWQRGSTKTPTARYANTSPEGACCILVVIGWSATGSACGGVEGVKKLLVERRMLLLPERPPRAPAAVLPCRPPAVHLDPQSSCRPHPRPPPGHRLPLAGPRPRHPSPAHPRPPAQRRSPARSCNRFRHLGRDRVAAHPRNHRPARRPRPEHPGRAAPHQADRRSVRDPRRHLGPHQPQPDRPTVLLRQTSTTRDESP